MSIVRWLSARHHGAVRSVSGLTAPQRTRGGAGGDRSGALDRQPQQRADLEAELYRLKARALGQAAPDSGPGGVIARTGPVERRSQHARSLELRAATDLARLSIDQDRRDDARTVLASIYDQFTEGFDTQDLKNAKAMLCQLQ